MTTTHKLFLLTILLTLVTLVVGYVCSKLNCYNEKFTAEDYALTGDLVSVLDYDSGKYSPDDFKKDYTRSDNWKKPIYIVNDYQALLTKFNDTTKCLNTIIDLLTSDGKGLGNSLDTLYLKLNWAKTLYHQNHHDYQIALIFDAVSNYWFNEIGLSLDQLAKSDPDLKYSYKYRYLDTELSKLGYLTDSGNTKFEKLIFYMTDSQWTYIAGRIWNGTTLLSKSILLCVLAVILFSAGFTISKLFINK